MDNNEFPNILFLETSKLNCKDELIDCYYHLLLDCQEKIEIMAVLSMLYDDAVERTGKMIIERQIIDKVKQLEELRANSEYTD